MTITKKCDWFSDYTCSDYWTVKVFDKVHRICNCCYEHLRRETDKEREQESRRVKNES